MIVPDDLVRLRLECPMGDWNTQAGLRDSAVLALLIERGGGDHLLFNRRRDDLPFHPGQVCFPGGARDGEEDAVACALRETEEEMGVARAQIDLLGRLPDRVSIAGFKVACFVGRLLGDAVYRVEASEVAEAFEIGCDTLLDGGRWSFRDTSHPLARFSRVPAFRGDRHVVWGLTGIILRDFTTQVLGFAPPPPAD